MTPAPETFIGQTVLGVGTDIVEVERIRAALERHGDKFLHRLYTAEEIAYCQKHRDPHPFLAARFAAKEAASKAFGTGIARGFGWKTFSVTHNEHGAPLAVLDEAGQKLLAERGAKGLLVSLSHTATLGHAMVLLVQ
ncbi:MAG TPA: holo-ACP synthase [Opitutales bacterium]|nr:holo-ACP synthase [Opitutales bacterium]